VKAPDAVAVYLDSSALTKLVIDEPESAALVEHIGRRLPLSCDIALTEVPRAVRAVDARVSLGQPLPKVMERVDRLFEGVGFVTTETNLLAGAALLDPPTLRTLDAIHIAAAIALEFEEFVTYDMRQATGAAHAGLRPVAPGA
jgi:predicted nucleic acid-binding protein